MPHEVTMERGDAGIVRLLLAVWWILFVPFTLLVSRFSFERGCQDPYELLKPVMQHQAGALLVAAVYLGGYVWVLAAGTVMIRRRNPTLAVSDQLHAVWGTHYWRPLAMVAVLAIEQVPRAVWQWIYRTAGLC